MRLIEQLEQGSYFGWLALQVVAQVTAVTLVAMIVARTILKRRAAARHRLWLWCLGCVLLSPAVAIVLDRARVAVAIMPWGSHAARPTAISVASLATSHQDQAESIELSSPVKSSAVGEERPGIAERPRDLLGGLILLWAAGIVVGLARRSREEVCDNFVLRLGDPCEYARTLLHVSELYRGKLAAVGIGLTDRRWSLSARVEGILDPGRDRITRVRPCSGVGLAVGLAMICIAIGALRRVDARSQESKVSQAVPGPGRVTKVRVLDAKDQPVAGAAVAAIGFEYNSSATTDAAGEAVLSIPGNAEVRWVTGLKAGAGFDYFENYRSRPAINIGPLPAEVTLRLEGSRTARIKAVDTSGRPVSGVDFAVWYVRKPGKLDMAIMMANIEVSPTVRARTNEGGSATFDWIPSKAEDVPFAVVPGAYSCPQPLMVRSGADGVVLEARLLKNTRISGVVRHVDGRPAAGIEVRAEGRGATNFYCRKHTHTDQNGSYSLDVYPDQSYMIAVLDQRWAARTLTGVIVREGTPLVGLDLTLTSGSLIHGVVTRGAGGAPLKGETITLVEHGQKLPPALVAPPAKEGAEDLPQWAVTDAGGRYEVRVGAGRYRISSPDHQVSEEVIVENQTEIVRDFRVAESSDWKSLSGVAIEKAAAGERPIPGALIEATAIDRGGRESATVADANGRFELSVRRGGAVVFYTRDPKGTSAGFTTVAVDAKDVRVSALPASRILGKVLDSQGRPVAGQRVSVELASGLEFKTSAHFWEDCHTDSTGGYEFRGVPRGAWARVGVLIDDRPAPRSYGDGRFHQVHGPDPISVPDITIP